MIPTTNATKGQGEDRRITAMTPPKNTTNPRANAHHSPLGSGLISGMGVMASSV